MRRGVFSAIGLFGLCRLLVAAPQPNVVLFLVDDMGWMDSTVYGSRYYETPHMERLARQSMRFTDAYALPLCSPSRASILSGQYSSRHRLTSATGHRPPAPPDASPYAEKASPDKPLIYAESRNYLDPGIVTIAEVLRDAGYRTGHFGKWHLGLTPPHWPDRQGFETTWHCAPDPGPPSYFSPYGVQPGGEPAVKGKAGNIIDGPDGEYITDRLTDEALDFIETHHDEPFFLNLWHYGVHGPWGHKEGYTAEFAKKEDPRGEQRNPIMASMLRSVDESLGRVMDKLDELGLRENTLFIFYSDNGGNTHSNVAGDRKLAGIKPGHPRHEFLQDWRRWAGPEAPTNNAPLREGKGRIYEGGQRVPLMVRWPGEVEAGSATDAVAGPIDLYPTILDALGIDGPRNQVIDGESLLPPLRQSGSLEREALFTWFPHLVPAVSVRRGDWKLIRRFEPHPNYPEIRELYNLADDIGESDNLAKQMPGKVRELDVLIDGFIRDTGALAPRPNPAYDPGLAGGGRASEAGLVPKMCTIEVVDGVLRVEGVGRTPFLGTAQVRHKGAMTLDLKVRAAAGGTGMVSWKTSGQEEFPADAQRVSFKIPAGGGWQAVKVDLPVGGRTSIIRLYLPAVGQPVEVAAIRYTTKGGEPVHRWVFPGGG